MRFTLWLAAGVAAMATASAAPARPGGGGHGGGGLKVGWSSGGGQNAGKGGHAGWGMGPIRTGPRHGRHHRRFGRHDLNLYGGAGIAGPVDQVDRYGNGFFTGGGGRIRLRGGRPYFDYDRSYPYEFASTADVSAAPDQAEETWSSEPRARCTFENGVRVCRGW